MTCEQTEEAEGVWGKMQLFQLDICGVVASAALMTIKVHQQAGWVRHCGDTVSLSGGFWASMKIS